MKFEVVRTRRKGMLMMRFELTEHGRFEGELVVEQKYVSDLNRTLTVATLTEKGRQVQGLEPLYDAVLTTAKRGYWTMTGFERDGLPGCKLTDYCQSWIMCPVDEVDRSTPVPPIRTPEEVEELRRKNAALAAEAKAAKVQEKDRASVAKLWPPKA